MRRWLPTGVVLLVAAAILFHGPIAQTANYHDFADRRVWLGIPNAADVLSNLAFALVGLWGIAVLHGSRRESRFAPGWPGYALFLGALILTAAGSGWYHLAPDNHRLVWDRIPIALACAGLLAAVRAETRDPRQPTWIPMALAVAAVASVLWWSVTESRGAGDLRPYLLMQGAPLVMIPIWQALHGSPRADRIAFGVAILLYVAAKVAEVEDRTIYEALGFVSGHTIKHLLAAAASVVIVWSVVRRKGVLP